MSEVDPNALFLPNLEGTALAIYVVSIVTGVVAFVVVSLRTYVRFHEQAFGLDDGLMLGGMVIYCVEIVLACLGAKSGLGTLNAKLNATQLVNSMMYLMLWMLLYICSLVLIKSSICMTMFRIASANQVYRICIFILLGIVISTFLTTFIGVLLLCQPVEANWNTSLVLEGKATCASMDAMIGLSYASTAGSIATDMACAVLPGFILWRTQMKMRTKLWVSVLLSFGSLASISTIIRTPFIAYYLNPADNLAYHVGNITLWSNVETAIGLVAGSLPSLRRFILTAVKKPSTDSENNKSNDTPLDLVTFGGSTPVASGGPSGGRKSRNRSFKNPTDLGTSVATVHAHGDGDWRRLRDEASSYDESKSSQGGIRMDYTYEVELSQGPEHRPAGFVR
ncbi:uncharacterized protein BCR38DRAFT_403057 [Pseudomassariella vexata]|uniref:Rhodopsin domain-containing protein n=1 Tax=Pseudomassariella vexata TaxID=1141098 RepID=A0A1Y2D8P6_9PEZI|nr:uncharacterized protein BCR38DRAFT_403057 [Pseudomassariella vexata]ORY55632.1 hypothetical protein BCR38DRAFT_403057 [Pseudomassariella vexata]